MKSRNSTRKADNEDHHDHYGRTCHARDLARGIGVRNLEPRGHRRAPPRTGDYHDGRAGDHRPRSSAPAISSTSSSPSTTARCTSAASGAAPDRRSSSPGGDDGGEKWGAIEPAISERARVCSYASFGTGTSDAPSSTQTFDTQAADLHALLGEAGEPGPYVVLGHSFGGAEAVTFASKYADEVSGLMLLDASPTTWPATVCSVGRLRRGLRRDARSDTFP